MNKLFAIICLIFIVFSNAYGKTRKLANVSQEILRLLDEDKVKEALSTAVNLKDRHLVKALKFVYYSDPRNNASFEEIVSFVRHNSDFPGRKNMLVIAESKINQDTNKIALRDWCLRNAANTGKGASACLVALEDAPPATNVHKKRLAKIAWVNADYTREEEQVFLDKYGQYLSAQDHIDRINYTLTKNKSVSKEALNQLDSDYHLLVKVKQRLALHYKSLDPNSNILEDLPGHLKRDPHLLYLQAKWYNKHKDIGKLKELLLKNANVAETKSDKWFKIRSLLVWDLFDNGDYKSAYAIASKHDYVDATNYVDGEWLAGKIAYSYLKNPALAQTHFRNILDNARYSTSIAKGAYWTAMTLRDLKKPKEAKNYFKLASQYVDTFYGQLAMMQLHDYKKCLHKLKKPPEVTQADLQWFKNSDLVIVGHILAHMHKHWYARKFIQAALDSADTDGKKYLMAKLGEHFEMHVLSTMSGKEAARRGLLSVLHAYPVLFFKKKHASVEPELVHAVIRQESEFDHRAVSYAGATGLMQLMPGTAKDVCRKLKQSISGNSLKDPHFNTMLGSHYLQDLLEQYDGSYILAVAAYNAGPGAVNKWIARYGDPRKFKNFDKVVLWIENIPFEQTRGYVQNVLSNLQIYRNLVNKQNDSQLEHIHIHLAKDLRRS